MSSQFHWNDIQLTNWDIHFYFWENDSEDIASADLVRQNLKKTFPSIDVFELVCRPVGPHPIGMWEAHIPTPELFGLIVPWIAFNHGHHSVLIHPNTTREGMLADHTTRAIWVGPPLNLITKIFTRKNVIKTN
eukprot:TRINITY_DN1732_c0_g3_i1.p1 TRINITY_DN1732_c0_g3~~TRINITY_DN1732_c0_g3_i1.p1  ORF type:complete len:133 (+),score=61.10 TRINITY_DN1732_c0_g3_i1:103-501(+)